MKKKKRKKKKKAIKKAQSTKNRDKKGSRLGYYCVAAIDILGQKEKLRALRTFPETDEENESFTRLITETYGAVDRLRESFKEHYEMFSDKERFFSSDISYDQKQVIRNLRKHDIEFQGFSDSTFSFVPLRENAVAVNGIYAVLMSAASIFIINLAKGLPLRGGIEVGIAAKMKDGDIYGAALNEAHYLEDRVAKHPRIVIGDELVRYLRSEEHTSELQSHSFISYAVFCLKKKKKI